MEKQTVAERLNSLIVAHDNCIRSGNSEWEQRHKDRIDAIMADAPRGSGIDAGTTLDEEKTRPDRLVFTAGYHHMNDGGYYDGWTEHAVTAVPSFLGGISIRIGGRDRNYIKDYLHDVFHDWLTSEAPAEE